MKKSQKRKRLRRWIANVHDRVLVLEAEQDAAAHLPFATGANATNGVTTVDGLTVGQPVKIVAGKYLGKQGVIVSLRQERYAQVDLSEGGRVDLATSRLSPGVVPPVAAAE